MLSANRRTFLCWLEFDSLIEQSLKKEYAAWFNESVTDKKEKVPTAQFHASPLLILLFLPVSVIITITHS